MGSRQAAKPPRDEQATEWSLAIAAPARRAPTSVSAPLREPPRPDIEVGGDHHTPASLHPLAPHPLCVFAWVIVAFPSLGLGRLQSWLAPSRQAAKGRAGDGMKPRQRPTGGAPRVLCVSAPLREPPARDIEVGGDRHTPASLHPAAPSPFESLRLCASNCRPPRPANRMGSRQAAKPQRLATAKPRRPLHPVAPPASLRLSGFARAEWSLVPNPLRSLTRRGEMDQRDRA